MDGQKGFAKRLNRAMSENLLSQNQLALELGVSEGAVSQWLSGKKRPARENIVALAEIMGVKAGWLEFDEGSGPEPDLTNQREAYMQQAMWNFRPVPFDGGRDFGNANVWSIPWDINALVREAIQNSLDAANDSELGIDMVFSIIRLQGDELESFQRAIKWSDGEDYSGLESHLQSAANSQQKLGKLLKHGLKHLNETKELIILRIDDCETRGLTGEEFGQSHFAALCRNNLDTRKTSKYAGGSYGLGKSVFWRASRFATVFFNSNLSEPFYSNGEALQVGRMIGKSDLAWHELEDEMYAGPGWLGVTERENGDNRSLSIWENQALAKDLYLKRKDEETGTSILVMGFHDADSDDPDDFEMMADKIEEAVAVNFWPAIVSGRLLARVRTLDGDEERRSMPVDPEKYEPELVDAYRKYQRGDLVDTLIMEGDVAQRYIPLSIPKRKEDPKHDEIDHEGVLLVRLDKNDPDDSGVNHVHFFRGQEMIILSKKWNNLVFSGAPFRAAVLCGRAAGAGESVNAAEHFLRSAEPPAHDNWMMTPDLRIEYARGGKAKLDRFISDVRTEIQALIKPKYQKMSDGPDALKRLLRITGTIGTRPKKPSVTVDESKTFVNSDGAWVVEGIIKVPEDRNWRMSPTLKFAAETGGGKVVTWSLEAVKGCQIENGELLINSGTREAIFKGISDPNSHPAPSNDTAVKVLLRNIARE